MTFIKFDPYRGFDSAFKRMNRFVSEFEKGIRIETGGFNPRVDIIEDESGFILHAELPGLAKDDIKITINEDRMLLISGEKKKLQEESERSLVRAERSYGSFERAFYLPEFVDLNKIDAAFVNGVLELKLTKKEPEKPKEVEITIA